MNRTYAFLGIVLGIAFALVLSAFTGTCTDEASASAPPDGWECHSDGTCARTATTHTASHDGESEGGDEGGEVPVSTSALRKAVLVMSELYVFGCVPTDEPDRVVFCDNEGTTLLVANGAVATIE